MKASRNTERVFRQSAIDSALFSFVCYENISMEMETKRFLLWARSLGMNTRAILELRPRHVRSEIAYSPLSWHNRTAWPLTRMIFSDTQAFPIKGDFFLFCLATELYRSKSKIISCCRSIKHQQRLHFSCEENMQSFRTRPKTRLLESQAEAEVQEPTDHNAVFILPLLLTTPTIQFSLDHKHWSHKQNQKKIEPFWLCLQLPFSIFTGSEVLTTLTMTVTLTPSPVKTSL